MATCPFPLLSYANRQISSRCIFHITMAAQKTHMDGTYGHFNSAQAPELARLT